MRSHSVGAAEESDASAVELAMESSELGACWPPKARGRRAQAGAHSYASFSSAGSRSSTFLDGMVCIQPCHVLG